MVVGTKCHEITGLTWIKGEPVNIPSQDKVLVLEFWATWCPPCKATIPHLTKLQDKYKSSVRIVGITTEEDTQKVRTFVNSMTGQMEYTVALDSGQQAHQLMEKARVHGIPHAFVIDLQGTIRYSGHPADAQFEEILHQTVALNHGDKKKEPMPLIIDTFEELLKKSTKDLKQILADRGIDFRGCIEKADLAQTIVNTCSRVTYYR